MIKLSTIKYAKDQWGLSTVWLFTEEGQDSTEPRTDWRVGPGFKDLVPPSHPPAICFVKKLTKTKKNLRVCQVVNTKQMLSVISFHNYKILKPFIKLFNNFATVELHLNNIHTAAYDISWYGNCYFTALIPSTLCQWVMNYHIIYTFPNPSH